MAKMKTASGETINVKLDTLHGRKVVTRRELRNRAGLIVPAGTTMTIVGWWRSGFSLEAIKKCKHCGLEGYIAQVHRDSVRLVPE